MVLALSAISNSCAPSVFVLTIQHCRRWQSDGWSSELLLSPHFREYARETIDLRLQVSESLFPNFTLKMEILSQGRVVGFFDTFEKAPQYRMITKQVWLDN